MFCHLWQEVGSIQIQQGQSIGRFLSWWHWQETIQGEPSLEKQFCLPASFRKRGASIPSTQPSLCNSASVSTTTVFQSLMLATCPRCFDSGALTPALWWRRTKWITFRTHGMMQSDLASYLHSRWWAARNLTMILLAICTSICFRSNLQPWWFEQTDDR